MNKTHLGSNDDALEIRFERVKQMQQELKAKLEPVSADYELKRRVEQKRQTGFSDFKIEDWR